MRKCALFFFCAVAALLIAVMVMNEEQSVPEAEIVANVEVVAN